RARAAVTPDRLRLKAVRHPVAKEIYASLRPGAFSTRRWRWHDCAANPTNPVEDRSRMFPYVVVTSQVECLAHRLNIPVRKKRPDVSFVAGQLDHCASDASDWYTVTCVAG